MVKPVSLLGWVWVGLFLLCTGCGATTMDKYDWQATESAPKDYPMEIVTGHLYYPGQGSLYVPDKKTIHHGWGKGISSHLVGPDLKPLPERLEITFFSYTENQFYSGSFKLPYEKIFKLFSEGYYSPKEEQDITYYQIVVGVAPGGSVAVWLAGIDKTTEVFSGQAKTVEVDWRRIVDNPDISREKFIQTEIQDSLTAEAEKALKQNGIPFGLWETYQKRYHWQPLFTGITPPALIKRVRYFNGEDEYLYYPLNETTAALSRAIPKEMIFNWEWPKGRPLVFKLYFDEEEIFDAFQKLTRKNQAVQLEMHMEGTGQNTSFSVRLRNDDEEIFLKHTDLKNYGVKKKK